MLSEKIGPGNIDHLSKTFPLEPLRNFFKVCLSSNIVKIRRMHLKRQSFDNCYIQDLAGFNVTVVTQGVSDSQTDSFIRIKYLHLDLLF